MGKGRLEAFSDGVLAIIITIMVLELKLPHSAAPQALVPLLPVALAYLLSFIYIGIYWNNHHNMLHGAQRVTGRVLWANLHLLFWLSLVPFVTAWSGENFMQLWPVVLYGFVLLMCGVAYFILAQCLTTVHGKNSAFANALGSDRKGRISVVAYALGMGASFLHPAFGYAAYVAVAALWIVPDRRFEKSASSNEAAA